MAAKQPWYRVTERHGYRYIRFKNTPPAFIRNRMRAAGIYFNRTKHCWIADDRFSDVTIIRLIGTPMSEAPTEEVYTC